MSKQYVLVNERGEYVQHYDFSTFKKSITKTDNADKAYKFPSLEIAREAGKVILDALHIFYGPEPYEETEKKDILSSIPEETDEMIHEKINAFTRMFSSTSVTPCRTCDASITFNAMTQQNLFPICDNCLKNLKEMIIAFQRKDRRGSRPEDHEEGGWL